MKMIIEPFTSLAGWTSPGTISAYALNQHADYISGLNTESVIFRIPEGNLNQPITKNVALDLTGYDEIIFSIFSRNKQTNDAVKPADFSYKIDLWSGVGIVTEYYIPTNMNFTEVSLYVAGITTISRIRITALHNDEDYLIISNMVAVKDELPLDIFLEIKEALEYEITNKYGNGILIGTTTASVGATSITISSSNFIERYATITIDNGINSETHVIGDTDGVNHKFLSEFDGSALLYSYVNANVYLSFPVRISSNSEEILLPSISIWGITPEHVWRGSKVEDIFDTFITGANVYIRRQGALLNYTIAVTCTARHNEILAYLSEITRKWIAKEKIYVNGRKCEIKYEGSPTETEPTQNTDIFPQIVYLFTIEIREELYQRITATRALPATVTYTIS